MKKIMFNDGCGLTRAVLELRKNMTRRGMKLPDGLTDDDMWNPEMGIDYSGRVYFTFDCSDGKRRDIYPQYQIGEVVAVAQSYEQVYLSFPEDERHKYSLKIASIYRTGDLHSIPGWTNKMFVRADLMPYHIRFTDMNAERLQDISDKDCLKEGVEVEEWRGDYRWGFYRTGGQGCRGVWCNSPQKAFASLIDRISGKCTWKRNPFVWMYSFELIK